MVHRNHGESGSEGDRIEIDQRQKI